MYSSPVLRSFAFLYCSMGLCARVVVCQQVVNTACKRLLMNRPVIGLVGKQTIVSVSGCVRERVHACVCADHQW